MGLENLRRPGHRTGAMQLAALALACTIAVTGQGRAQSRDPDERPMPVVTASAAPRTVPIYLRGIGTAVASKTTVVRSDVEGRLTQVDFTADQPVQTGDLLARIDSRADQAGSERHTAAVSAPASGVIGEPMRRAGDRISPHTSLAIISRIDPIRVDFDLPETALREVRRHASHQRIAAKVYGTDVLHPLAEGYLRTEDDERPPEPAKRTLTAIFPNAAHALSPGMTVEVLLRGNATRRALVIPRTALRQSSIGYYTYIVTKSGTAHIRPLVLGDTNGEYLVVQEGLRPGDVVVTDGQEQLTEGSHVAIVAGPSPGQPPQ